MQTEMTDLQAFLETHLETAGSLLPGEADRLAGLRRAGREAFAASGWPTKRLEAWKYTDLRALLKRPVAADPATEAEIDRAPGLLADGDVAARLVFVDGRYRPGLSRIENLPAGLTLIDLKTALAGRSDLIDDTLGSIADVTADPMVALNTALIDGGTLLHVARGVTVTGPIEIVSVTGVSASPRAWSPRHLWILDEGSAADVVEVHVGLGEMPTFANAVTEIRIGDNARLRHFKHHDEGSAAANLAASHAVLGRDARFEMFTLTIGALLSRTGVHARLEGAGGSSRISGAYLLDGDRHCDNTSVIELAAPHTGCRQLFKGVLDDRSHGVFQGRIVVEPHAQHVDGHQLSRAILLSADAEVAQKPELEIWADDVKCSHGATVGDLDRDALFYLRARGLPEAAARRLLIEAFLTEAFEEVDHHAVRTAMTAAAGNWMRGRRQEIGKPQ